MPLRSAEFRIEVERLRAENERLSTLNARLRAGGAAVGAFETSVDSLYHAMFEATPTPMCVYDTDSLRFIAVNSAAVRHLGYTREDFAGMTVHDIQTSDQIPMYQRWLAEFRRDPRATTRLARMRRKDGTVLDVEVTGAGVRFCGCNARVVSIQDVTERIRLEEELRRAQKLESVGRLAGGVAHDFNNLLTAILGYTQLLETRFARDPAVMADLSEIRSAGTRARDLTKQLLVVARRQVQAPSALDLSERVEGMRRLLERVVGERVRIETQSEPALWPIAADPAQIDQILVNLADNARDAMPYGGTLRFVTSNAVTAIDEFPESEFEPGPCVLLEVSDEGVGMSAETLSHLFEPFFTTKPTGVGTGLGLATVYGIVRQSGGHVRVHSEPGKGSTFRLYFPRAVVASEFAKPDAPDDLATPMSTATP